MAGSDRTVKVRLVAEVAPYNKGMRDASTSTTKLGSDIEGAEAKSKGFATSAGKASSALKGMALAGAAVAGTALVAFLSDAVSAAGDLEQSIGGVDSVFKDTAGQVHDFGKTSAESVGLSRNAFNELITVTGALLKNKGLEDFTGKSLDLVKVGADLAATFGGSTKDAVDALNAAMRGESDPIERYGISLNETAVNAELASKGLKGLTGQALEQAKAQARIDIVMRQSADALGQFGREADTLQGQQQRLSAKWEDAQATLGQALLPALTQVVSALSHGVDIAVAAAGAWGQIPGPVKAAAGAMIAMHVAHGPLLKALGAGRSVLSGFGEAVGFAAQSAQRAGGGFGGLSAGLKTFTGSAGLAKGAMGGLKSAGSALMGLAGGPWGLAIAGLTAALAGWWQAQENAKKAAEEFGATLEGVTATFTEQSRKLAAEKFFKDFAQTDYSKVSGSLEKAGVSLGDLVAAYEQGGPAVEEFKKRFDEWTRSQDATKFKFMGGNVEALGNSYAALGRDMDAGAAIAKVNAQAQDQVAKATKGATVAVKDAAPALDVAALRAEALAGEAQGAADANKALASAMLEVSAAAGDADAAEIAWKQSIADTTKAITENGRSVNANRTAINTNTQAGRDNAKALLDMKDKALASAKANLANGESAASVTQKMTGPGGMRDAFVAAAQKAGLSATAAQALATKYGLTGQSVRNLKADMDKIPKKVVSDIEVGTAAAKTAIAGIQALLKSVDGKVSVAKIRTEYVTIGAPPPTPQDKWVKVGGGTGGGQGGGGRSPVGVAAGSPWGRYPSGGQHRAYDYPVPSGTPVRAPLGGRVILTGWDPTGFGNHIRTADSDGRYSLYAHLSRIGVKMGQAFGVGSVLGLSGNSGHSTGPHLHYERRRNIWDPNTAFKPYAAGGPIAGHSPHERADNIPVMATADEYMIRQRSALKLGRSKLDWINAHGTLPLHLADGGPVSRMPARAGGAGIDYARLAAAIGDSHAPTFNAYGLDADQAVQKAMRQWEFKNAVTR